MEKKPRRADDRRMVHTTAVYPPIPIRSWDWCAYRDPEGTYGWGATEMEAIEHLLEQEDDDPLE